MCGNEHMRSTPAAIRNDNGTYETLGNLICELIRRMKKKIFFPARIAGMNFYMDFEEK
jgi:hypothetical protein